VVTAALGLPMSLDLALEYAAGFGVGPFIVQALFMKQTMGGSYRTAVRRSSSGVASDEPSSFACRTGRLRRRRGRRSG
jgi:hypothetical protein